MDSIPDFESAKDLQKLRQRLEKEEPPAKWICLFCFHVASPGTPFVLNTFEDNTFKGLRCKGCLNGTFNQTSAIVQHEYLTDPERAPWITFEAINCATYWSYGWKEEHTTKLHWKQLCTFNCGILDRPTLLAIAPDEEQRAVSMLQHGYLAKPQPAIVADGIRVNDILAQVVYDEWSPKLPPIDPLILENPEENPSQIAPTDNESFGTASAIHNDNLEIRDWEEHVVRARYEERRRIAYLALERTALERAARQREWDNYVNQASYEERRRIGYFCLALERAAGQIPGHRL